MKVVACQTDIAWHDKAANFDRVRRLLGAEPPTAGSLVVLPEMFATGFSMDVTRIRESESRETASFLAEVARRFDVYVLAGLVTAGDDTRASNEAVVVSPDGEEVVRYAKVHPFSYAGESRHYRSGDEIHVFPWGAFTVAPFICYDLRFPELFRAAVVAGADLLVVIANWPTARVEHWVTLLRARAVENQAYVVGVNRTGEDPHASYPGRTLVVSPRGEVLADAGDGVGLLAHSPNHEELRRYRREFPVLSDMRSDLVLPTTEDGGWRVRRSIEDLPA